MKKILFLLLSTVAMYGQVPADATPLENIQITNNTQSTTATKVNVQENDGTINTKPLSELANYLEFASAVNLPVTGEQGKLYLTKDNNRLYRFNGTIYQELTTDISGKEDIANKQNSLVADGTGVKFPTVDATNAGLANKLNLINAKQFGALADGTTNDTTILQAYLDSGQGTYIFPKGNYSISGLDVSANSKLIFEKGAVLVLRNNSDRPVLQNKNFSVNTDKNIEIYGLEIEGNEGNQIKFGVSAPYTGEPTSGVRFFGVENLKIISAKINKARTYGIWLSRVKNGVFRDIEFNQSILTISNQDGIHFNGLCYNLEISNIRGVTNDDMIALNANDVAQGANVSFGEIKNVIIKDVIFDNNLNGIRLLSAGNLLDKISIQNLSGSIRDNVIAISSYTLGTANFGAISIDNVKVDTTTPFNIMGEYGGYILVNDKIDFLKISNVFRKTGGDARPTVRIQSRANISKLVIDNITTVINQSLTTYYPEISFESGSVVSQAFISDIRLMNGVFPNGIAIGATGSNISRLHLTNIYAEQIGYGLYLNNTDISTLFVDGTTTNFIRYPFYLVNDSDVGLAVIANQEWLYSISAPKVYNILDTSSIVFAHGETANTIVKWDDNFMLAPTPLKDIDGGLQSVNNNNGYALDLSKTAGFGSALALRSTSGSSNSLLRMFNSDNVTFTDFFKTATGISINGTINVTGTVTASPATVSTELVTKGQLDAVGRPYKVYTALISQTGTNAPVATVLENTLGGTVVWTRTGVGQYAGTLSGVFTVGKVLVIPINGYANTSQIIGGSAQTINNVRITSYLAGTLTDGIMGGVYESIEIRVYN